MRGDAFSRFMKNTYDSALAKRMVTHVLCFFPGITREPFI